jgi:DNA-binding transcriptional ArsR family regulator
LRRTEVDAEELLGSRGRIRVLRVLAESGELNISEVGRRTGMNYTSVERHLNRLREMGLLREKRYGKIRIFEALFNNVTVRFERNRGVRVETDIRSRD